jgi:hypothetical protein
MSREFQVTFDCADPAALAAFWAEALDYDRQSPPQGFDTWEAALAAFGVPESEWNSRDALVPRDGAGPRVFFQRVPEGKTAKNRVHLDLRVATSDLGPDERMAAFEAEADRLEALGATRAYRVEPDPAGIERGFLTMRDPEGNEFCLD